MPPAAAPAEGRPRPRDDLPEVPGEGAGAGATPRPTHLADDLRPLPGRRADPGPARRAAPNGRGGGAAASRRWQASWRPWCSSSPGGSPASPGNGSGPRNRGSAETNLDQNRKVVNEFFTKVSTHRLLDQKGLQPLRKELLEDARKYYQMFLRQRVNDRALRAELAKNYFHMAPRRGDGLECGGPDDLRTGSRPLRSADAATPGSLNIGRTWPRFTTTWATC